MMKSEVLEQIKSIAVRYAKIKRVILFGSRARGDYGAKSDYDIAIDAPNMDIQTENRLLNEIEQIDTFYKIDIVFLSKASEKLAENIRRDGIVIMGKFEVKFENYKKAISRLCEATDEFDKNPSLAVRDGAIQRFEFTAELAWKTVREYLIKEEFGELNSPKSVMAEAFRCDIIDNEEGWLGILRDRNTTSHIYDDEEAGRIYSRINETYIGLFKELETKLESIGDK